jgi:hypothetical protein
MKVLFSLLAAVMHSAFGSFNPLDHDDSEYPDEFVAAVFLTCLRINEVAFVLI